MGYEDARVLDGRMVRWWGWGGLGSGFTKARLDF